MAQMVGQGTLVCPDCGGKGKSLRFLNRKPHVCHLCNGRGTLTPMGDLYHVDDSGGCAVLIRTSWWPTEQAMATPQESRPIDIYDERDDYIPSIDLRETLWPLDGSIGSAPGC